MLSPAEVSTDERWFRAVSSLARGTTPPSDPQRVFLLVATAGSGFFDRLLHRRGARERLAGTRGNQLGDVGAAQPAVSRSHRSGAQSDDDAGAMRLVALVREGAYRFHGATETTISHGEGWRFVQLGKFIERACNLSMLLDAYFSVDKADDLDWVGLLTSCAAFESYCRVFTADLQPDRIAKFLLVQPEFPYSVRYSVDRMHPR